MKVIIKDPQIRKALISKLSKQGSGDAIISEEVSVLRGRAVADVVAGFKTPHCFEIKSDADSLRRLEFQTDFFSQTFPKITLVATTKHLPKAFDLIPSFWGALAASEYKGRIIFSSVRKCSSNELYRKENLLNIIWNNELREILKSKSIKNYKNLDRAQLTSALARESGQDEAYKIFNSFLETKAKAKNE
mgnify:CR=1 FL=1